MILLSQVMRSALLIILLVVVNRLRSVEALTDARDYSGTFADRLADRLVAKFPKAPIFSLRSQVAPGLMTNVLPG